MMTKCDGHEPLQLITPLPLLGVCIVMESVGRFIK